MSIKRKSINSQTERKWIKFYGKCVFFIYIVSNWYDDPCNVCFLKIIREGTFLSQMEKKKSQQSTKYEKHTLMDY
jgi:hypothetical protein